MLAERYDTSIRRMPAIAQQFVVARRYALMKVLLVINLKRDRRARASVSGDRWLPHPRTRARYDPIRHEVQADDTGTAQGEASSQTW